VTITVESLVELDVYPGDDASHANAVNAEGYAVGWSMGPNMRPVLWSPGGVVSLVEANAWGCTPVAINTARWVVGQCGNTRAVIWRGGQRTVLDTTTFPGGAAMDLNESGQAVGWADPCVMNCTRAVIWEADGSPRYLNPLAGDDYSRGWGINAVGHVAGESIGYRQGDDPFSPPPEHAVLWAGGSAVELGTLSGYHASQARDVNDAGVVAANACRPNCFAPDAIRAFTWDDGTIVDLGTLRGSSEARAINNDGWVVGVSGGRAWVWAGGTMSALPLLSGTDACDVSDINDASQAVGACLRDGLRPVMWTVRVEQGAPR
jgi:uncharacterized membrane protein